MSAVKIFADSDNENLWLLVLRHVLCIPSVQTMIENRRRKFIGNLVNDAILTVVHGVMTFNMCFSFVLIVVFFRSPHYITTVTQYS